MKPLKLLLATFAVVCVICFWAGCRSEEQTIAPDSQLETTITNKDETFTRIGKMLALSVDKPEIKAFLKQEVVRQFDGDYDILFHEAKSKKISVASKNGRVETMSFGNLLTSQESSSARTSPESLQSFMDAVQKQYPLMQISIPQLSDELKAENWKIDEQTPLVAVKPADYDEKTTKTIPAYESRGKRYDLSTETPPDRLVIVVGESERIIAIRKNKNRATREACMFSQPYYSDAENDYYMSDDYYASVNRCQGDDDFALVTPLPPGARACDRDVDARKDQLFKFKFSSMAALRDAESWVDGKIEPYVNRML